MTPSILRITLAIAAIVGVGVVMNIFSSQERYAELRKGAIQPTAPKPAARPAGVGKASREAEARRAATAVRGHLQERGYLPRANQAPSSSLALSAAVLAFQFDHNLSLTAVPTDKFLELIIFAQVPASGQHPVHPETEVARKLIGEVQRALAHLGYGEPDITMKLDKGTRKAIRKFERARGLQVSGRISAPLIKSLGPAFEATNVKLGGDHVGGTGSTLTAATAGAR